VTTAVFVGVASKHNDIICFFIAREIPIRVPLRATFYDVLSGLLTNFGSSTYHFCQKKQCYIACFLSSALLFLIKSFIQLGFPSRI